MGFACPPGKFKRLFIAGVILSCASLVFVILNVAVMRSDDGIQYGIMIDASRTETIVYLYKWAREDIFHVQPAASNYMITIHTGLHTMANSAQIQIDQFFDGPLQTAAAEIPEDEHAFTPIYLRATAGVRELPLAQQTQLLAMVKNRFLASPFDVEDDALLVMPGLLEGAYAWLAVNHLKVATSAPNELFYGATRLGSGASQIAFLANSPPPPPYSYDIDVRTGAWNLYVVSDSGYGITSSRTNFLNSLNMTVNPGLYLNPCTPLGWTKQESNGKTYAGGSDFAMCRALAYPLLKKEANCSWSQCSFNGQYFPPVPPHMQFIARDNYLNVMNFLGLPANTSLGTIEQAAMTMCQYNLAQYQAAYGEDPKHYCFEAVWMLLLMNTGWGFALNETVVLFTSTVDGIDTEWALGAMIEIADRVPFPEKLPWVQAQWGNGAYVTFTVLLTLLIFVGIALAVYAFVRGKRMDGNVYKQTEDSDRRIRASKTAII